MVTRPANGKSDAKSAAKSNFGRHTATRKPQPSELAARSDKSGKTATLAMSKPPVISSAPTPAMTPAVAAATAAAPEPSIVTSEAPPLATPELRKRELIEAVVTRSGVKKRDAKPAVEAALSLIAEALAEGRELNLAQMGKFKINRVKKAPNGRVIIGRFRQSDNAFATDDDTDDDASDDSGGGIGGGTGGGNGGVDTGGNGKSGGDDPLAHAAE